MAVVGDDLVADRVVAARAERASGADTDLPVIVAAGTTMAWQSLGGVGALVHTGYGQLLLAKIVVLVLILCAAWGSRGWIVHRLEFAVVLRGDAATVQPIVRTVCRGNGSRAARPRAGELPCHGQSRPVIHHTEHMEFRRMEILDPPTTAPPPPPRRRARSSVLAVLALSAVTASVLALTGLANSTATPAAPPAAKPVSLAALQQSSAQSLQALQAAPEAANTTQVTIQNYAFAPAALTITAGTTVVWTNKDTAPHTVTISSGPEQQQE